MRTRRALTPSILEKAKQGTLKDGKPKPPLPKQIFVYWEPAWDKPTLVASDTIKGIEDGVRVGIYNLEEIKVKVIAELLQ